MKKDKELDDLFKNRLEDPVYDTGHLEDDWNDLERMLGKPKRRPAIVFWLPILSSAAAILLFFGWWLFKPQAVPVKQQQQVVEVIHGQNNHDTNKQTANSITDNKTNNSPTPVSGSNEQAGGHNNLSGGASSIAKNELAAIDTRNNIRHTTQIKASEHNFNTPGVQEINNDPNATTDNDLRPVGANLVAVNTTSLMDGTDQYIASTPVQSKDIVGNTYRPDIPKNDKEITKLGFVKHPQYSLTVLGASELNGANSFGDSKSGTNVGLLFSAGVFNKLTVTTGANYSVKPYNTDIANYHTNYAFRTNPSQIEADCRVLDIPINLDYQLYNKHKNKFSIGSGLSSYIMLHESYQYYYADPNTKGPVAYTVPSTGKYFFGILNLQATYQRQVNSKVSIGIQPYMKLPLTNIGYSQVRLQTAGVAVGLSWKINSLTKP